MFSFYSGIYEGITLLGHIDNSIFNLLINYQVVFQNSCTMDSAVVKNGSQLKGSEHME